MKFRQDWKGTYVEKGRRGEFFPASVPGNIQLDYAKAHDFGDVNWADNCRKFKPLEDYGWIYQTELEYTKKDGERIFFVTHGIEYEYDVMLNGKKILHHVGMFSKAEVDITDELANGNLMEIYIYPHPKREGADDCREQADQCCKPAVQYDWDWHPRLLVSGIWDDTYIESRNAETIVRCEPSYELDDSLSSAVVRFDIECESEVNLEIFDPDGKRVYQGSDREISLQDIKLWWCNGQGEPNLYHWRAASASDEMSGYIGFKRVRLVMNGHAWDSPSTFPKSRSNPPITIELNGRAIFAKGSNWVNPEIFTGTITEQTYAQQLTLVKDANMNIVRCWGGAIVNKDVFFDLCDKLGIMVWQEFPLACNNYVGTEEYLTVLEQEAAAIINRVKKHACLVLWCGGNELFNCWSKMTDQSYALRLLNKLCYELDRKTPFIMTAPVMGMGHGHYVFYDPQTKNSVFELFRQSDCTAYSEFGIPSITEMQYLQEIFPSDVLRNPAPNSPWETHKAFNSWVAGGKDTWMCMAIIDEIFGKQQSLEEYIEKSAWMQSEGLKCVFEEARRQKPECSMALNWCFNEPWVNAAGLSLLTYPSRPKKSYYAVRDALRNVIPSARFEHFKYYGGDTLIAELWLLNDSTEEVSDTVDVFLETDGQKQHIITWNTGLVPANTNKKGHKLQIELPCTETQPMQIILEASCGSSAYRLLLCEVEAEQLAKHALNV